MHSTPVDLGAYEQAVGHHVRVGGEVRVNLMCRVLRQVRIKMEDKK